MRTLANANWRQYYQNYNSIHNNTIYYKFIKMKQIFQALNPLIIEFTTMNKPKHK